MIVMWIFGYGSLIWRPDFDFVERRPCVVAGYKRRFYQGSEDHRGTPESPGRVVTLLPDDAEETVGVAYRLDGSEASILRQLDYREKNGYCRLNVMCRSDAGTFEALTYIATVENEAYLGPAPLDEMAAQISVSEGPSGMNRDYLFALANALRDLSVDDSHVFELEAAVRQRGQ